MRNYALVLLLVAGCGGGGGKSNGGGGGGMGGGGGSDDGGTSEACKYPAGSMAKDTLQNVPANNPIQHVILVMKENRSYDEIFGKLHDAGQPDSEPLQAGFSNPDGTGAAVANFHNTNSCYPVDPGHQWDDIHAQLDKGMMDGFVTNAASPADTDTFYYWPTGVTPDPKDGHFVMGYFDQNDLPYYYWLANTFAVADRYFPSVASGTWANRDYVVAGTSDGTRNTGFDLQLGAGTPLIFDELDKANVSWQVYSDDTFPLEDCVDWTNRKAYGSLADFFSALAGGTLPAVTYVDATSQKLGSVAEQDEHPPADVQFGEAWTKTLIDNVMASPVWPSTALFFTYDEAGGHADHVPPPTGKCTPDDNPKDANFTELGPRVPFVVVSPYAKRHFVSHVEHEHTSILKFIELTFGVPALSRRDANSDALLDMFDFTSTPAAVGMSPAAGSGLCTTPQP